MSLSDINRSIHRQLVTSMQEVGDDIARSMKSRLQSAGHIDTGALYNSIRSETLDERTSVNTYVYADAKSPEGTQYAEFIELGTGAAHGRAGGRVGTWRYKDREGNWHTTDGMDADPFIEPSVDEHIGKLGDKVKQVFYDIAKYGRTVKI